MENKFLMVLKHMPIFESPVYYPRHLIFSEISVGEFERRLSAKCEDTEVPEILREIDESSHKNGRVAVSFFDGTVIKGVSLGIEPDFDEDGEILGYYVVGIKVKKNKVVLVPDYLDPKIV